MRRKALERDAGPRGRDPGVVSVAAALARRHGIDFPQALRMTLRMWGAARSIMHCSGRPERSERWRALSFDEKAEVCGAVVKRLLDVEGGVGPGQGQVKRH